MHWACVRGIWYADECLCWMIVVPKTPRFGVFLDVQKKNWSHCSGFGPSGHYIRVLLFARRKPTVGVTPLRSASSTRKEFSAYGPPENHQDWGGLDERQGCCSQWELCHELQWNIVNYIIDMNIMNMWCYLKQAGACGRRPGQFPRGGGRGCLSPSTGHI